jgi:PilZ domain
MDLPELEQRVTLELAPLGRLAAHVSELVDDDVLLDLFAPSGARLELTATCNAVLEWIAPGGVRQVVGTVTNRHRTTETLLVFTRTGRAGMTQRRSARRHEAVLPAYILPDGGVPPAFHTFTVNISGTGLLVAGPAELSIGTTLVVRLNLPGGLPLEARARVARHDGLGLRGIEFLEIDDLARDRILHFISERQRLERAFLPPT